MADASAAFRLWKRGNKLGEGTFGEVRPLRAAATVAHPHSKGPCNSRARARNRRPRAHLS